MNIVENNQGHVTYFNQSDDLKSINGVYNYVMGLPHGCDRLDHLESVNANIQKQNEV